MSKIMPKNITSSMTGIGLPFRRTEKLWVRVKFTETTKMNAYSLGGKELEPIGVSPFL